MDPASPVSDATHMTREQRAAFREVTRSKELITIAEAFVAGWDRGEQRALSITMQKNFEDVRNGMPETRDVLDEHFRREHAVE